MAIDISKVRDLAAAIIRTEPTDPGALTDSSGGTASQTIVAMTNTTALTHSVGTADATVADVGGAFNQTTLNDNFKEVTTQLALQRTLNTALVNAVASLSDDLIKIRTVLVDVIGLS